MSSGADVVHSLWKLAIFLGILSISTVAFTVLFWLPQKARMNRTTQRVFAGLELFLSDGLLLLGSLTEAKNFIFLLIAFVGFNGWLLMELNVQ